MPSQSVHVVRRSNLLSLYSSFLVTSAQTSPAEPSNATDKAFAEKLAIANTSFSSYKSGARVIGDRVARQIEPLMGLPTGWMDSEHADGNGAADDEVQLSRFLKLATRAYKRAGKAERKRLETLLLSSMGPG